MSGMHFMEKLLDGVEVEWKALGEITTIKTGQSVNKQMISTNPGEYPVINSGRDPLGFIDKWNTEDDPIGVTTRGAGVGSITWREGKYYRGNLNYSVTTNNNQKISTRYLYHLLLEMQADIQALCTYDGIPALNSGNFKELKIPIPCPENPKKSLEIQAEIVRILDTFTELTTELTTELKARKKQYNHYRDQLIVHSTSKTEKLSDIAKIYLGLTYTPKYVASGVKFISAKNTSKDFLDLSDVKYISEKEFESSTSNAKPKRGDVLFTRVGSNLGHPVIVDTDESLCIFVSLGFIRVNPKKVLNSYIKHWMNTDLFWDQVRKNTHGAAKVNLNTGWLNKFDVILPSLTEQARIVATLDKFDALTSSLTEGLPREIALRQQQYEYYRDLLLSFPKSDAEVAA